jgi:exodeoxyribonuclease V alpha subunit
VELTKNYRFKENSRMGAIALAIKKGDARESWNLLEKTDDPSMLLHDVPLAQSLQNALREVILLHYSPSCVESDPVIALESFNKFRVLCAIKNGPFGVIGINAIIERILSGEGLIRPISSWYAGRPVMIIANDYGLNLFNGDIGITLPDPSANNELKIFFKSSATGNIRSFSPHRLPPHETVYAMTIHKAQGSEFDHTVLVLPPVYTPVLSRELLYTGITRARQSCRIWSTKDIFMKSVENATERMYGLRDKLWKA